MTRDLQSHTHRWEQSRAGRQSTEDTPYHSRNVSGDACTTSQKLGNSFENFEASDSAGIWPRYLSKKEWGQKIINLAQEGLRNCQDFEI